MPEVPSLATMNYWGLAAVLLGLPIFVGVESQLRPADRLSRWLCFLLMAVLAIPSVLFAVYYLHLLPEAEWFYELRSFRGSELLAVFLAAAAGALASFWPRKLLGFPLFGFLLLATIPHLKPILDPLDESALVDRWQDGVYLQSAASTCGPACLATILTRLGVPVTEREVARACHTSARGTEAWYLARYARAAPSPHGVRAGFCIGDGFAPECGFPAVVGVRIGGAGHFIAVLENQGDTVSFADPLHGAERISLDEFRMRYTFTGFHMYVVKN